MDDRITPPTRDSDPPLIVDRRAVVAHCGRSLLGLGLLSVLGACASHPKQVVGEPTPGQSAEDLVRKWSRRGSTARYEPVRPASPPSSWHATSVRARSSWANGGIEPRLMARMQPVTRITLHHDGMSAFTSTGEREVAARLELIRRAHRGNRSFGDIGYHYLVDPAGRVWEGRPLAWQGAHVARQNHGNLGICCLGNFEKQSPTEAQLAAVEAFTISQMHRFNVPVQRVFTHRELAATACPGRTLQPKLLAMRRSGGALARA